MLIITYQISMSTIIIMLNAMHMHMLETVTAAKASYNSAPIGLLIYNSKHYCKIAIVSIDTI